MPKENRLKVLIYGYGNPGREDDGAGIALCSLFRDRFGDRFDYEENYQLNAEDALLISEYDIVIFIDASCRDIEGFSFAEVKPDSEIGFTTHAMKCGSVVALCRELYDRVPDVYLLEIKGFRWEMKEKLTEPARENVERAFAFLEPLLASVSKEGMLGAVTP